MASIPSIHEFTVDVIGDQSGERFAGKFCAKTTLTHREQLRRDELRRMYLGSFAGSAPASPRAENQAMIFAEINIRLSGDKAAPNFWRDSDGGMDLLDDNVIQAVYKGVQEGIEARQKALADAIKDARKDIQSAVTSEAGK